MFETWLRKWLPAKELGWPEIGERFTRFVLLKTRFVSIYLHKLDAPVEHPQCHDHPWHFWTLLPREGYWEQIRGRRVWRGAGDLLYRPAASLHGTTTKPGRPMWSVVIVSRRVRSWGMSPCDPEK